MVGTRKLRSRVPWGQSTQLTVPLEPRVGGSNPSLGTISLEAAGRLAAAMTILVLAGTIQEVLLLLHHPSLGILLVGPALVSTALLWGPRAWVLVAIAAGVGLELLLPLMTGGGMVYDWVRHYQISLHYAGRPTHVLPAYLASRTALSEQLGGAFLNHVPTYWVFQAVSLLLNTLWLWPASLLVAEHRAAVRGRGLLVLALSPYVLYYTVYSWPWGFAAFFLLGSAWLAERDGVLPALAVGVGAAGALLVHPGMLGYVVGLAAWVGWRRRRLLWPALAAGAAVLLAQLPWVYDVTSGGGIASLVLHSDPGQAHAPIWVYLVTRPMLVIHTLLPFSPLVPGLEAPDLVLSLLIHSLPGAVVVFLLVKARALRPRGKAAFMVYAGGLVGLAIYPAEGLFVGIVDALYPAVLLLGVGALCRLTAAEETRALRLAAAGMVLVVALALGIAAGAGPRDRNQQLRATYSARYLVEVVTPLPGALILAIAGALVVRQAWRGQRPGPGRPGTREGYL
ncbi:MAG: hypothetical protein NVSMB17_01260 [Candidatus Dormibacteria bacterium]